MNIPEFEESLEKYNDSFTLFTRQYGIPLEFLLQPDHIAIKCADRDDYLETCQEIGGLVNGSLWEFEEGGRTLASGQLVAGIPLIHAPSITGGDTQRRPLRWIEIMQPKPGKESREGYVEHVEFTYEDLFMVEAMLYSRAVEGIERQSNPSHSWVNIPITSDSLLELKINDKSLQDMLDGLLIEREVFDGD